jgi:hypothetical protein
MLMTDATRPLILGYLRKHLLMTEEELADTTERLAHFAQIEGFALGTVYVEQVDTAPAAFQALVEAANRDEVTAVVVPSMLHFAVLSAPATIKQRFEHLTGARVVVANLPPP